MKTLSLALAGFVAATVLTAAQGPAPAASCAPANGLRFVCGQAGPEDLVAIPGTAWLVASAYDPAGGLFLIDTKTATSTKVFPGASVQDRLDTKTYDTCPGPLTGMDRDRFRSHGLAVTSGANGTHTLYVVHHGARESVEVFELSTGGTTAALTWVGCAVAPDPIGLNSVAALPDGGFVATNFDPRSPTGGGFTPKLMAGENNGEVWEWHTGAGWEKVPGSESAGANGIELSADGKWYYVSQWGNRSFLRISRGATPVSRDQIPLGFRVDNMRWAPDGTLLVAGQGDVPAGRPGGAGGAPGSTSVIGKVDPNTMTYREIINYPTSNAISPATVAVQVGDELWTGSFRGDRLVVYPAAGIKP